MNQRTEKTIAIIVFGFNCLTNLLLLVPTLAFVLMAANWGEGNNEMVPFVLAGVPAVIFSYAYSVYFIRVWFFKPYEQERALLAWAISGFHYFAFLAYMVWLLTVLAGAGMAGIWVYLLLAIPLMLSFLGVYINRAENFAEQKTEDEAEETDEETDEAPELTAPISPEMEPKTTPSNPPIIIHQNQFQMTPTQASNPNNGSSFGRFSQWLKESIVVKLLAIGFLVLILLIPNTMVKDLIYERQMRQGEVTNEVSKSWGGFQSVTGPVLSIPYSTWSLYEDGKRTENTHVAYFLPKKLNVDGNLPHQTRKRSIFQVILYQAELKLSGEFDTPDFASLNVAPENIHWEQARLSVGIGGMTGIKEQIVVDWGGKALTMAPGTASAKILPSGVSVAVPTTATSNLYTFSIPIKINGSGGIRFEPVGKSTNVNLKSTWPSPSFTGDFLPDERTITKDGFSATWQVLDLNRSYPQQWSDDAVTFAQQTDPGVYDYRYVAPEAKPADGATLAVRLVQPVDQYLKNTRAAKYAILVIGLTFLLYLFFEVLQKLLIHPFQYFLVGLAVTVFYLLLLSLSEHVGFNLAYLVSAGVTVLLITGYSWSFLGIKRLVFQLGGLLVAIYGFIFVLLQLEDYALLAGSVGVFLALATVMYSSRKVDWYNLGRRSES